MMAFIGQLIDAVPAAGLVDSSAMAPTVCDGDAAASSGAPDSHAGVGASRRRRTAWGRSAAGCASSPASAAPRTRSWSTSRWRSPRRSPTPSCTPSSAASPAPCGRRSRRRRTSSSVVVTDDGRGMQPRADSPGLGLGLPTIASLTTAMDMHSPPGGGTVITMTFAAPGVQGPARRAPREAELLDEVARTVEGTWPGEGVERLVDLLVPGLADACALDVIDVDGHPQRFAGRIDGPDGAAPVRLADLAQAAHRRAAVRRPPGHRRRRPARRRTHPRAHRADHLQRQGRRSRWPRPASTGGS